LRISGSIRLVFTQVIIFAKEVGGVKAITVTFKRRQAYFNEVISKLDPGRSVYRFSAAEMVIPFLPAHPRSAKISRQLNFDLQANEMIAMTKCPRCNLEQKDSPQCRYCGLVFEEFRKSTPASKNVRNKRRVSSVTVLVVAGVLLASYLLIAYGEKSAGVGHSSDLGQRTTEDPLKSTAKELSGDAGILSRFAGGYTQGGIIAVVIFSIIGLGYMAYGKKSQQLLMLVCGLALMGYSYLVNGTVYIILIGIGLSAIPFIFGSK
jgi:hypothetical protein